jgi:hypothetical protein
MRESGFRGKTLPRQSELVRALAHIDLAGLKCTSNQSTRSLSSAQQGLSGRASTRESPPGVWHSRGSSSGKRAIEQTPTVAARRVTT